MKRFRSTRHAQPRPSRFPVSNCRTPKPLGQSVGDNFDDGQLLAWELERNEPRLEQERLHIAWPKGENALARGRAGRRYESARARIGERQHLFAAAEPATRAGAAGLLGRALAAIEAHACRHRGVSRVRYRGGRRRWR